MKCIFRRLSYTRWRGIMIVIIPCLTFLLPGNFDLKSWQWMLKYKYILWRVGMFGGWVSGVAVVCGGESQEGNIGQECFQYRSGTGISTCELWCSLQCGGPGLAVFPGPGGGEELRRNGRRGRLLGGDRGRHGAGAHWRGRDHRRFCVLIFNCTSFLHIASKAEKDSKSFDRDLYEYLQALGNLLVLGESFKQEPNISWLMTILMTQMRAAPGRAVTWPWPGPGLATAWSGSGRSWSWWAGARTTMAPLRRGQSDHECD